MLYLDLDELPQLFQDYWLWSVDSPSLAQFRRQDHLGDPNKPLKQAVLDEVEKEIGIRPAGSVRLLTNLRYFGYIFNPLCLYYCFDSSGDKLEAIVAHVSNTPWNERYIYVLNARHNPGCNKIHFQLDKEFHVSPFMCMDIRYDWRFITPDHHLLVHMENRQPEGKLFDATLAMKKRLINRKNMAFMLIKYPFLTAKIIGGIYLQALCLFLKKIPFHPHPEKKRVVELS
jgi:DUF1365 family protein